MALFLTSMKTSDFTYHLPEELIASQPLTERSASRLLCMNKRGEVQHKHFYDLPDLLQPGDLLVFNNSRVIPARLYGFKPTGGKVEVLIERILSDRVALAHVRGGKGLQQIYVGANTIEAEITGRQDNLFELMLCEDGQSWGEVLAKHGHMPLPPYMKREDALSDKERYQTVYAAHDGSVAAPTAGLHFDDKILQQLKDKGVEFGYVTLHVGAGTFQPVKVDDVTQHKMHSEILEVSQEVCDQIAATKARGGRVVAVGTTSVRSLETSALRPYKGETDIFIYPGYDFKVVDAIITNFHLPESTLLMLVSAFSGKGHIMNAYRTAVQEKYRFFSYGDAMFLMP